MLQKYAVLSDRVASVAPRPQCSLQGSAKTENFGGISVMARTGNLIGLIGAAAIVFAATSAMAQIRDAVYRGTLVCDKLPFAPGKGREAIEVTITGSSAQYTHIVRLHGSVEAERERGTGTISGQDISLHGAWKGGGRQ